MSTLLSVSDARQRLISKFSPLEPEVVNLEDAHGRILADAIVSPYDYPLFDNSSMDGFAVRAEDIISASEKSPVTLIVVADLPAGQATSISLENQQAIRIMTGAPLPKGADAVVPVENTDQYRTSKQTLGDFPTSVIIYHPVNSGDYIRPRGQDINAGDKVLSPGATLRAQEVGFLAMLGIGRVPVYRRPRVAILSTGDELLPLETPLQPGKIHDSNAYTLAGQIERDGGEAIKLGIVKDDAFLIKKILDRAFQDKVDLIISSAGVSVGAFDFVRQVVETNGRLDFWRVNMRPGKPIAFGVYRGIPFVGLPGNPVSAFVGYEVFVNPAIMKMCGLLERQRPRIRVRVIHPVESDGRESYLRAIVEYKDGGYEGRLTGHQGSGNLRSLTMANALLIIPSGVKSLPANAEIDAWMI